MTIPEKNRMIAEWLEGKPESELPPIRRDIREGRPVLGTEKIGIKPDGSYYSFPKYWYMCSSGWTPMDFHSSEEASALVLEKERFNIVPTLTSWHVGHRDMVKHPDRKTAIVDAAIDLILAEKGRK